MNISTASSSSFMDEHKMDNIFRTYEQCLLGNNVEEEMSDIELSFEKSDIMEKFATCLKDIEEQQTYVPENPSQIDGFDVFVQKMLRYQHLQNDDQDILQMEKASKTIKSMENKKAKAYIYKLSKEVDHREETYPAKIANILQSKYDQLLNDLKTRHETNEQRFQKRIELIEKQTFKSDDSCLNKITELNEQLSKNEQELNETIKHYEIILEMFKSKQTF